MVPSSGSTTQRTPLVPRAVGALLAEDPVVGPGAEELGLDQRLRRAVHLGDHVGAGGLGADLGARAARGRPGAAAPPTAPPARRGRAAPRGRGAVIGADTRFRAVPDPLGRVDLRSDTVTRPTPEMRRAMAEAEVGDDGFGDDPTVARLEAAFAERVGKEAALFVPSGHDGQPDRAAAARAARAPWCWWVGASTSSCARRPRPAATPPRSWSRSTTPTARIDPDEVARWVADARVGWAEPSAVFVEDTHGEVGGRVWPLERLDAVAAVGPAGAPRRRPPLERGGGVGHHRRRAGRGRHHGHVLRVEGPRRAGRLAARRPRRPRSRRARVERKRLGGGMRQVGILAAAGLVALDRVDRLADDHERARRLAKAAAERWPGGVDVALVHTNIVRIAVGDPRPVLAHLAADGVLAVPGQRRHRAARHPRRRRRRRRRPRRRRARSRPRDRGHHPGAGAGGVRPPRRPRGGVRRHARPLGRRSGAEVHLVIACRGEKGSFDPTTDPDALAAQPGRGGGPRRRGAASSPSVEHLGYPDGEVENDAALRARLVEIVRRRRPDALVAPDPDGGLLRRQLRQPPRPPAARLGGARHARAGGQPALLARRRARRTRWGWCCCRARSRPTRGSTSTRCSTPRSPPWPATRAGSAATRTLVAELLGAPRRRGGPPRRRRRTPRRFRRLRFSDVATWRRASVVGVGRAACPLAHGAEREDATMPDADRADHGAEQPGAARQRGAVVRCTGGRRTRSRSDRRTARRRGSPRTRARGRRWRAARWGRSRGTRGASAMARARVRGRRRRADA